MVTERKTLAMPFAVVGSVNKVLRGRQGAWCQAQDAAEKPWCPSRGSVGRNLPALMVATVIGVLMGEGHPHNRVPAHFSLLLSPKSSRWPCGCFAGGKS